MTTHDLLFIPFANKILKNEELNEGSLPKFDTYVTRQLPLKADWQFDPSVCYFPVRQPNALFAVKPCHGQNICWLGSHVMMWKHEYNIFIHFPWMGESSPSVLVNIDRGDKESSAQLTNWSHQSRKDRKWLEISIPGDWGSKD